MQETPQALTFKPLGAPQQFRTPNGPGTLPLAKRACRIVAGHPEGFHEGFANRYSDAAAVIAARRAKQAGKSEADIRAYVIADNKLAENAGWNRDLLALEFQYLSTLEVEYDLTLTGFRCAMAARKQ